MKSVLEIDGKKLYPVKEAVQKVSYSRDHITRLAREGKIVASNVGRQWYVDLTSLQQHIESTALEQEIRKKHLRAERRRERQVREEIEKRQKREQSITRALPVRSAATASFVLSFGLVAGLVIHQLVLFTQPAWLQTANTHFAQDSQATTGAVKAELQNSRVDLLQTGELTQEVRSLGEVQNGVFLLPEKGSTTVAEMFSDTVEVRESDDGSQTVVRINADGEVVGNEIPFVEVPVKRERM